MWERRLLTVERDEVGSAVIESVFGIFVLLFLVLGTIQVALSLYARNVVMAAVHDGARAAIEIGADDAEAAVTAREVVERSAGSLVDDLEVSVMTDVVFDRHRIRVTATGYLEAPGPVPIRFPLKVSSTTTREVLDAGAR